MSLSPPDSPNFENGPPLSLSSGPSNEARRNLGLFEQDSDNEIERDNIHIPLGSTPKDMNNAPTDRYGLRPKDSPNYNNIINLVK